MNKTIVIFESKYGSTKRYAEWISQTLSCPLLERKNVRSQDLSQSDIIIYGGGLYAGGVSGIKLLTQNWKLLSDKKVILFTCGLADPKDSANVAHIREALGKTLSPKMLKKIHIFHLRGGIDYSKLNFIHKSMMSMLRKMLLKKEASSLSAEDKQLLETYGKVVDFTDSQSIQPLVDFTLSIADTH